MKHISCVHEKRFTWSHRCPYCDQRFSQHGHATAHIKSDHKDRSPRPYLCPECGKGFTRREQVKTHFDCVHERLCAYRCPYCDKCFYREIAMMLHIANKQERRGATRQEHFEYECSECGKGFPKKSLVRYHVEHVHDKLCPHGCPHCDKGFYSNSRGDGPHLQCTRKMRCDGPFC